MLLHALIIFTQLSVIYSDECHTGFECTHIKNCTASGVVLYPCNYTEDPNYVCCWDGGGNDNQTSPFPDDCGQVDDTNRITHGENAVFGDYPWMVLLGYLLKDREAAKVLNLGIQFYCDGTLITNKHVLTAAHCNFVGDTDLVSVRLREHDLAKKEDCIHDLDTNESICYTAIDIDIDNVIVHELFDRDTLKNDIALIRLKSEVTFSDYVVPICLPFNREITHEKFVDRNNSFIITGWGRNSTDHLPQVDILQWTTVRGWNNSDCNRVYGTSANYINDKQLCANEGKQNACNGDSGGPLQYTRKENYVVQWVQIGIISYSNKICGIAEFPTVYTKVDEYLDWITSKVSL